MKIRVEILFDLSAAHTSQQKIALVIVPRGPWPLKIKQFAALHSHDHLNFNSEPKEIRVFDC